jgi:dihydroorotase
MAERFDTIILGGTVVSSERSIQADVGIRDGKIVEVDDLSQCNAEKVLDAAGLHVLPGVIDTQVHFREPGLEQKEDIESGSRAAVMGGVTSFFEMPNTNPLTITPEALQDKLDRAEGRAWSNYSFFVGGTEDNADQLAKYEQLPGTPGIKIFMGSSTGSLLAETDDIVRAILSHGEQPCPVHSEDEARLRERKSLISDDPHPREHPFLRDPEAARLCTERLIRLSEETGRPVHVLHISTKDELPMLREAKEKGLSVTCEVTPQHMTLNADLYESLGTKLQMNPPIRSEEHRKAIFEAMQEGLFDVIGSDHAPHTLEEKDQPYPKSPSGMPGVQTLLPVMLNWVNQGALSLEKLVDLTAEAPANLYEVKGKGHIAAGYDADVVLVDLGRKWTVTEEWLQSKCGWSPYEGWELTGAPAHVLVNGVHTVKGMKLQGAAAGRAVEFEWKR